MAQTLDGGTGSWWNTCLTCVRPWASSPALHKPSVEKHAYNPSIWEMEVEGSYIREHPSLGGIHEACLKQKTNNKQKYN